MATLSGTVPTIVDLYRRYLHASTVLHAAPRPGEEDLWWGVAHGFRESVRIVARDIVAVRRVARARVVNGS